MSAPEDPREGGQGGWEPQGWRSEWQQPTQPEQQQPTQGGWRQEPDGRWVQVGSEGVQQSSGKATASLVLGIIGLVLCPFICSVLALVFGYQGRNEIDQSGGRLGNRGNATAGIVLGWIGVGFCVLFLLLIVIGVLAGDSSSTSSPPAGAPA